MLLDSGSNPVVRVLSLVPVGLVVLLTALVYQPFVFGYCVELVDKHLVHPFFVLLMLVPFHVLFLLYVTSYIMTVYTHPGLVPNAWRERYPADRGPEGGRWCSKCEQWKPERAHHCSVCNRCVLKMDHHCPWIANCVGHHNHKYFLLFVWYGALCCLFVTFAQFGQIKAMFSMDPHRSKGPTVELGNLFSFILAISFGISLLGFSALHLFLVLKAKTTLEMSVGGSANPYDHGWRYNWKRVMGQTWWRWLLPVPPDGDVGDGCSWGLAGDGAVDVELAGTDVGGEEGEDVGLLERRDE